MTMDPKCPLSGLLVRCALLAGVLGVASGEFCADVDVRGNVSHFKKLAGCKVVVGYLQIVLFDEATVGTFQGISYPELEEITGYFLIFQVPGLLSIGELFPNLKIVRGMEVIMNYAFMLYNVTDLTEVRRPLPFIKFPKRPRGRHRGDARIYKNILRNLAQKNAY